MPGERRLRPAEAGRAAGGDAGVGRLPEGRIQPDDLLVEDDRAAAVAIARGHLERVGIAVGHGLCSERRRQLPSPRVARLVAVVPVGQRPVPGAAELDDLLAQHRLDGCEVTAVPGQEVPGLVLALAPAAGHLVVRRQRVVVAEIALKAPAPLVEAVNGGEVAPARRLVEAALGHLADTAGVPHERIAPAVTEPPDVPSDARHGVFPPSGRVAAQRQRRVRRGRPLREPGKAHLPAIFDIDTSNNFQSTNKLQMKNYASANPSLDQLRACKFIWQRFAQAWANLRPIADNRQSRYVHIISRNRARRAR